MTQDTLGRTREFSASSPSWSDITPSGGLTLHDFILDPWNPATTGYMTTDDGVFKSTTLDLDTPVWEQLITKAQIESQTGFANFRYPNKIVGSINVENWVGFWFMMGSTGVSAKPHFKFGYSSNGGTTWTFVFVNISSEFPGIENADSFGGTGDIVPHLVGGNIVLYAQIARGGSPTTRVAHNYKSTDGGATWTLESTIGSTTTNEIGWTIHCPYTNNEDGQIVYSFGSVSGGEGLAYSLDGASTWTEVMPFNTLNGAPIHRWGGETYTQSPQSYFWFYNGTDTHTLYISESPTSTFAPKAMSGISGLIYSSGGFPYVNSQFYAVGENGIYVSTDAGDTWVDKTGDWAFGLSSTYSVNFPKGGAISVHAYVIVPNWTE
jgi:hypothetical protein